MLKAGDVLDLGPIGATFHVRRTAAETDGRSLEMEWELAPRTGGTPVHVHPHATEGYEVLEGELDVYVDGSWRTLRRGETVRVAPGVPHTFRNGGDLPARVFNTHEPAMRFGDYFAHVGRVATSGAVPADRMTPKTMIHLAMVMTRYPEEIRAVKPPHAVMRVLAAAGRLLGYRV
jgi:mannose-6-phosphate isomerase-like protein (cupin superfamily)